MYIAYLSSVVFFHSAFIVRSWIQGQSREQQTAPVTICLAINMKKTPMHQYKGRELLFIIEIAISFSINDQKVTNKENTCIYLHQLLVTRITHGSTRDSVTNIEDNQLQSKLSEQCLVLQSIFLLFFSSSTFRRTTTRRSTN